MTMNAAADPMIGRMVDGRYRVRSRIARGGMATVYLATDVRLDRRVAIKIMHSHLADDVAFRERFIQEARSAARLSHPNLVGVYDQGTDDDCAYIVMEYIPGMTLRDLLKENGRLTSAQTLDVLRAVLAGLASAHRAGIVHRDLKPENVFLADDGRIKLGDFGLARAATANTATGAALLGTIAYLSPELVTRGIADARSDIYALGIMLYEMLTGEQPYRGDQPMQIAYQHANDTVPAPSRIAPDVSPELDDLVRWTTARDPEERPRDAQELLDEIDHGPRRNTGDYQTSVLSPENATAVLPNAAKDEDATTVLPRRPTATRPQPSRPAPMIRRGLSPAGQRLADKSGRRRRRGWIILAIVLAVMLVAAGVGWWIGPGPGGNVRIPAVAGRTIDQARQVLEAEGLHAASATKTRHDATIAKGRVSATAPATEQLVRKGTSVVLLVSNGPKMISLPTIVGESYSTARAALAHDFELQQAQYAFSSTVAKDSVVAATGRASDGTTVDLSTVERYSQHGVITLTVSLGAIPDVVGATESSASQSLTSAGLTVGSISTQYSDKVAAGAVISQTAEAEPAVRGTRVDLVISNGPAPIQLPDVKNKSIDDATSALKALGLQVSVPKCTNILCTFYDWKATLPVSGTDPAAGSTVHKGDTITLKYEQ